MLHDTHAPSSCLSFLPSFLPLAFSQDQTIQSSPVQSSPFNCTTQKEEITRPLPQTDERRIIALLHEHLSLRKPTISTTVRTIVLTTARFRSPRTVIIIVVIIHAKISTVGSQSSNPLLLLFLPDGDVGGEFDRAEDHGYAEREGGDGAFRYDPAHAFDVGA